MCGCSGTARGSSCVCVKGHVNIFLCRRATVRFQCRSLLLFEYRIVFFSFFSKIEEIEVLVAAVSS